MHEHYMKMTIEKTLEGIREGQTPFGAAVVRDSRVIALAHNRVWADTDITAHAEVTAIREACRTLDSIDLSGSTIYSTCEPCPMCYSAIHWAKIDTIVFGAAISDAGMAGFNELSLSNETMKSLSGGSIEIIAGCLREECAELFQTWLASGNAKKY